MQDEQFIKEANKYKKETRGSIYTEIIIQGEVVPFEKQRYFEEKVEVYLPQKFVDLPEAIRKVKYPGEGRPQIIKTTPAGGLDIGLNLLPLEGTDAMTKELGEQMYGFTKTLRAGSMFFEQKCEKNPRTGLDVYWYDFISKGIDGDIYNFLANTAVAGQQISIVCNCEASLKPIWQPVFLEVANSVKTAE